MSLVCRIERDERSRLPKETKTGMKKIQKPFFGAILQYIYVKLNGVLNAMR